MKFLILTCYIFSVLFSIGLGKRRKCQDDRNPAGVVECEEEEVCQRGWRGAVCGHPQTCGFCSKAKIEKRGWNVENSEWTKCKDDVHPEDVVSCNENEECTEYWGGLCGHPLTCGYCEIKRPTHGCGANEERVACGDTCDTECSNYKKKNLMCTAECRMGACDCVEGYVRRETGGACIKKEDCPAN